MHALAACFNNGAYDCSCVANVDVSSCSATEVADFDSFVSGGCSGRRLNNNDVVVNAFRSSLNKMCSGGRRLSQDTRKLRALPRKLDGVLSGKPTYQVETVVASPHDGYKKDDGTEWDIGSTAADLVDKGEDCAPACVACGEDCECLSSCDASGCTQDLQDQLSEFVAGGCDTSRRLSNMIKGRKADKRKLWWHSHSPHSHGHSRTTNNPFPSHNNHDYNTRYNLYNDNGFVYNGVHGSGPGCVSCLNRHGLQNERYTMMQNLVKFAHGNMGSVERVVSSSGMSMRVWTMTMPPEFSFISFSSFNHIG
jgi:hypothetical protein